MKGFDALINFANPSQKGKLWDFLKSLKGTHRVRITVTRGKRSSNANRYYWACVIKPFAERLVEDGTADSGAEGAEIAHEYLKRRFNARAVAFINKATGEEKLERLVISTTKLDGKAFFEYVEKCRSWLRDTLGIVTMDPGQYVADDDTNIHLITE